MKHTANLRLAALLALAGTCAASHGAQAGQQYAWGMGGTLPPGQMAPSPSTNFVSGNSTYANPYQVPPATATSYQPVSVPGSSQVDTQYPPINQAPASAAPAYPSYTDATPAPAASASMQQAPAPAPPTPVSQYRVAQATNSGVSSLPSYTYDPNLDAGRKLPYRTPAADQSNPAVPYDLVHPYMGLETRAGLDLGAQWYWYSYAEPSFGVSEDGSMYALQARGTATFDKFFAIGEASYSLGDVDYDGSGTLNDVGVDSWEFRGLFGRDFRVSNEYSLSPYIGIGYRTLFNDNRGMTSDGAFGYRRYNELWYLPIGVSPRTHIDSDSRLTANFEFDVVLHGSQTSYLADANQGDPNIQNEQSSGYGLRGEIMYETRTWSFGPTFTYWNIDQSDTKNAIDGSPTTCAPVGGPPCIISVDEPANHTFEAGLQFRYHFF